MENERISSLARPESESKEELEIIRTSTIFSEATGNIFILYEHSTRRLIFVSRAFKDLTGLSQRDVDILGRRVYQALIHEKDLTLLSAVHKKTVKLIGDVLRKKKSIPNFIFTYNFRIKAANDEYLQVDNYFRPVSFDERGLPKISASIMRPAPKKGLNRFVAHFIDQNMRLYYSGGRENFVSEQKVTMKDIELKIIKLASEGYYEASISRKLNIKPSLVKHYKRNIFKKFHVSSMTECVYIALLSEMI